VIASLRVKGFRPIIVSSYIAVFAGISSLYLWDRDGTLWFLLPAVLIVVGFILEDSRYQIGRGAAWTLGLFIPLLACFFWLRDFAINDHSGSDGLRDGLGTLLQAVIIVKIFQSKKHIDWILLYLLSFLALLMATTSETGPLFVIVATVNLVSVIGSLFLMELERNSSRVILSNPSRPLGWSRVLTLSLGITITTIILSIPLFYLLPRLEAAGLADSFSGVRSTSGFSDSVELGSIGRIMLNESVVLRAKLSGSEMPSDLLWRGVALDRFEHRSWSKSKVEAPRTPERNGDVFILGSPNAAGALVTQDILMEPLDTPIVFALDRPLAVKGNVPGIEIDSESALRIQQAGYRRISLQVTSQIRPHATSESDLQTAPSVIELSRYLQLPPDLNSEIERLASEVISSSEASSDYDSARAIETHLRTNYGYTLEQRSTGGQPLADFLFNVKEGHCEYFASAMAVMLRTKGIPTRVVNGFRGGEFNQSTGFFVVRQSDAHSWVEVFLANRNLWVTFDPTPPSERFVGTTNRMFSTLRLWGDTFETLWIKYFVSFDALGQRGAVSSIRERIHSLRYWIESFMSKGHSAMQHVWNLAMARHSKIQILILIGGLVLFLATTISLMRIYHRRSIQMARIDGEGIPKFYRQLTKLLDRKGYRRRPSQTPIEFARETKLAEVVELTEIYHEIRFGGRGGDRVTEKKIIQLLRSLGNAPDAS